MTTTEHAPEPNDMNARLRSRGKSNADDWAVRLFGPRSEPEPEADADTGK